MKEKPWCSKHNREMHQLFMETSWYCDLCDLEEQFPEHYGPNAKMSPRSEEPPTLKKDKYYKDQYGTFPFCTNGKRHDWWFFGSGSKWCFRCTKGQDDLRVINTDPAVKDSTDSTSANSDVTYVYPQDFWADAWDDYCKDLDNK